MEFACIIILIPLLYLFLKTTTGIPRSQEEKEEPQCFSRFDYEYKVVHKLVALENNYSQLQAENEKLHQEIEKLKNEITEHPVCIKDNDLKTTVAFLAVLNQDRLAIPAKQTVVFETVVTNIGNAYNPTDGVFTATYTGLYQFSATILADNSGEVWCSFSLNGEQVAYIYARASDSRHDQGSHTIILQLKKGDSVCVKSTYQTSIYGNRYTSFSGVLLKQLTDG